MREEKEEEEGQEANDEEAEQALAIGKAPAVGLIRDNRRNMGESETRRRQWQ